MGSGWTKENNKIGYARQNMVMKGANVQVEKKTEASFMAKCKRD